MKTKGAGCLENQPSRQSYKLEHYISAKCTSPVNKENFLQRVLYQFIHESFCNKSFWLSLDILKTCQEMYQLCLL